MTAASSPAATARKVGVFNTERTGGILIMIPARMTDTPPITATSLLSNAVLLFPHHLEEWLITGVLKHCGFCAGKNQAARILLNRCLSVLARRLSPRRR